MRLLTTFFWRVLIRVAAGAAIVQGLSWLYGIDDVVRVWLIAHRGILTIGLIIYVGWDYLMYGGKEAETYLKLKSERKKGVKK